MEKTTWSPDGHQKGVLVKYVEGFRVSVRKLSPGCYGGHADLTGYKVVTVLSNTQAAAKRDIVQAVHDALKEFSLREAKLCCSVCGKDDLHHAEYVRETGKCLVLK